MIIRLLRCYAMFDRRYSNRYVSHLQSSDRSNSTSTAVLIQYRPFPNRSIITLQTWQCNGIGSTKMRVTANFMMRVIANYQYAANIVYKIWVWYICQHLVLQLTRLRCVFVCLFGTSMLSFDILLTLAYCLC